MAEYYRVEFFKNGKFYKYRVFEQDIFAERSRIDWERKGKDYTTRMFRCNKNGNSYSGREIY